MSLIEVITKASANTENIVSQSEYPIVLNPDGVLRNLTPSIENPDSTLLALPVTGWEFSEIDTQLIDLSKKFYTKLKRKLKDKNNFDQNDFIGVFNPFLEKVGDMVGISVGIDASDFGYNRVLVEKLGPFMGRDVGGLVLEACFSLEIWDLVEVLIVNGIVDHSHYSKLVTALVAKRRSDLLCLSVKHATDLGLSELLSILKYFLCPPKDAYNSMANVREEWESQALLAVEKVRHYDKADKKLLKGAKDASILLMLAYDGFSASELCLHYVLASANIDEVIFSSSISKLNGKEMMSLIGYLGKWLKKYEMFPQAGPCPKAISKLGIKICAWVPKLEDIVRCFCFLLDENFSSLLLHPEFHEELKSIDELVASLASEATLCCSVTNVINHLSGPQEGQD